MDYEILKNIEFPSPVADIVLQHHERINGSGYPKGLKDSEILLEARILAISDVVEAMSSYRPYRPAFSLETVLKEISEKKGILYDSNVVEACIKLFKEKNFKLDGIIYSKKFIGIRFPQGIKREGGENPPRSRHCNWGVFLKMPLGKTLGRRGRR